MTTQRKIWAMKRNWLIRRLRGAKSIFSGDNIETLYNSLEREDWKGVSRVMSDLNFLVRKLSESKWKE